MTQTPIAVLSEQYRQHMAAEEAFDEEWFQKPKPIAHDQKNGLLIKRRLALQEAILTSRATSLHDAMMQLAQISVDMDWLTECHHTAEHMSDRIDVLKAALASAVLALADGCKINIAALVDDYFPKLMEHQAPIPNTPVAA